MSKLKNLWHNISWFFEHGDLTPFAVIVSVFHYAPVLAGHDNIVIAWFVGVIIDMLHFRSVRHVTRNPSWLHALTAAVTTAMASMYHLRFYDNDWLLALPIPIGIAILAMHAAEREGEASRVDELLSELENAKTRCDNRNEELHVARQELRMAAAERDKARQTAREAIAERDKLRRRLSSGVVELDKLTPPLADYVQMIASGEEPDGKFIERHGTGKTTLARANSIFWNGASR